MTPDPSPTTTPRARRTQTSEFRLTIVGAAAGLALVVLGLWNDNDALVQTGVTIVGIATGTYAISRGRAKRS